MVQQHQIDAHAEPLVEVTGAVVPVRERAALERSGTDVIEAEAADDRGERLTLGRADMG